ncbi:MAG: ERCC4 domain-containing protein [Kofleriaceae bacterium]|nr:ERCC4 domain-containing protein [Kofleriaceae bacterium]
MFVVAKNPDAESTLPYLVRLPIDGGLILKVRDTWPKTARVYCHPHAGPWPDGAEIIDETPIVLCNRRGPAIDLVLDRPKQERSQFVFTQARGRSMIFWQTRTVAMKANPGGRVPKRRALTAGFTVHVDTREKYAFRFAGRDVTIEHTAVDAGDYGVRAGDRWLAVVERKSIEDFMSSLSNGTLVYQMAAMAELPLAAVVVEGRYPKLFEARFVKDGWLPDVLARLQIRYREIPIVFADSRKFAEEWTYRFLATALADLGESTAASDEHQHGMSSTSAESHSKVSTASTARTSVSARRSSSR